MSIMGKLRLMQEMQDAFDMLSYIRVWLYNDPVKAEIPKAVADMYYYATEFNNCLIRRMEDLEFVHIAYIDMIRLTNKQLEAFKKEYLYEHYFMSDYEQRLFIAMEEVMSICEKDERKLWWTERRRLPNACIVISSYMPTLMMPRLNPLN